jgi:predicted molibdopterin-dependent oxidoreductase YjgC
VIAIGENQVLADRAGALADALTHVPFIAVHEVLPGELGKHAQVLLPATTFAERDGTYTNLERRVQRVRKAIAAQGESRPAWEFISALAKRMGAPGFAYAGSSEIMGEIARCAPSYAGVTYARLEMSSLQWPVEGPDHAGTPALHAGRFLRGLGLFQPLTWRDVPLAPAGGPKEGALVALAGVAREIKGTVELAFGNLVEISSADAAPLGISDGDRVTLSSAMGTLTAKAHVNGRAPQGTVLLTMPQFNVVTDLFNKVTPGPLAAFAQAKSYPVRLAKAAETTHPMPTATPQGGALR